MASHGDEMMYLFHLPIPILFCDLADFFGAMAAAWEGCVEEVGYPRGGGGEVGSKGQWLKCESAPKGLRVPVWSHPTPELC